MSDIVTEEEKPLVLEVKEKDGIVSAIVIEYGPFKMTFGQKKGKISLSTFERFDGSRDEPSWIPRYFFNPAISIARGIFASRREGKSN